MLNSVVTRLVALIINFSLFIGGALFVSSTDRPSSTLAETTPETAPLSPTLKASASEAEKQNGVEKLASLSVAVNEGTSEAVSSPDTEDRIKQANKLVQALDFEEALQVLNNVQESDKHDYKVEFLQAGILSWAGKHNEAEQKYLHLRQKYPQNSEVLVSHGFLKVYQKDYAQAKSLFNQVLEAEPDYQDASRGLSIIPVVSEQ